VFVELEEGIDGLIHISDLSWNKKKKHPSDFCKIGDKMEVVVLEIDPQSRRLSLGHKQLEENPWDAFETTFTVGSIHEGTIIKINDKGAIVALPYGLEGFAPHRQLVKEDGKTSLKLEEKASFQVLEFNKDTQRILLSHSRLHEAKTASKKSEETSRKRKDRDESDVSVKKVKESIEKTTLGDIGALSDLKSQLDASAKKAAKKSKPDGEAEEGKKVEEEKPNEEGQ
jgi:small subunit ribosomal protein S1